MRMMRCRAELTMTVTGSYQRLELWPGLEVDLDRELAPGYTLAEAVRGREEWFEPVVVPDPTVPPIAPADVPGEE